MVVAQAHFDDYESQEDKDSHLLRIVRAIAISPENARRIVESYVRQSKEKYPDSTEWEHKLRVADKVISRFSKQAAMVGSTTALSGVIPGVGTAVAVLGGATTDTALSMKFQVDMSMCLADVFGYDITSADAQHLAFLIAAFGSLERSGAELGVRIGSKAGVRMLRQYLKGAALQAVKQVFRRVGITFTRKALEKAIPFGIGVAIGGAANYGLTRYVGRQAKEWFIIDSDTPSPMGAR